jgi:DNA-binding transcriptional LysR family regulator
METYSRLQDHIEKLRVLNYVGRSGSITKAASLLHMTQAAASHSIRVLENVLNIKLLHREARGVRLTDSGKILFDFSQRLLADIQSAEARTLNPYQQDTGVLRIGTHETLAIHVWPPFLRQFGERHPKVSVSLISGRVDGLIQGLLNREYQIVMSVEPLKHRDIQSEEVYAGVMGLFIGNSAATKSHPILKRDTLSLAAANEVPILTDASAHIRQNLPLPVFLMDHGFSLDRFYELNSFEAAMRLAMIGIGIAVVPERNASSYVKDGLLRPLKIKEINPKKFGNHRICASIVKEEQKHQPIIRLFFDELITFCRKEIR